MLITLISIYCDWVRLNCNSLLNVIHIGEYLHYNSCMYMCNMNILCLIFCNLQWVVVLSVSILIGASVIVRISLSWNAVVTLSAYIVCVPATYECTIDAIGCQLSIHIHRTPLIRKHSALWKTYLLFHVDVN